MKSVAILSRPHKEELAQVVPDLLRWLKSHGYTIIVDPNTAPFAPKQEVVQRSELPTRKPGLAMVLGGDGTLLSAARAVASAGIPILGVNLGSLGFLTEVPVAEMYDALEAVDAGNCPLDMRSMLHCELQRDGRTVDQYEALNDTVVSKSAIARLIGFELKIDGVFVFNYKADGVIVATPTGSTAYSLAAGGPILMPSVDAFVISPVCPHALTQRPLVVRDSAEIELVVQSEREEAFLSIDGQVGTPVLDGDRVVCRRSEHRVKLYRMKKSFFDVLRSKLRWGER
jgi:NAD+ kinase